MDATRYLATARRWWWLPIFGAAIAAGAYAVAVRVRDQRQGAPPPTYAASATFFVAAPQGAQDTRDPVAGIDRLTQSYATIITGRGVAQRIVDTLRLDAAAEDVQARISARTPPATQLIVVTAKGATPVEAEQLIDGVTQSLVALRHDGGLPGAVNAVEVDRARLIAAGGRPLRDELAAAAVVAVFGALGAAALAAALEYVTDAVRDRSDAERAGGLPVLACIPSWNIGRDGRRALAMAVGAQSGVAERFRMLRTSIALAAGDAPAQALLVAPGSRGAGGTVVAANIAAALAQTGRRVVLVDADMRAPSCARVLGVTAEHGLAEALGGDDPDIDQSLCPAAGGVTLLPAGSATAQASELLDSGRFDALMRALRERFDTIVIDSPPALEFTDATLLAKRCDAAVIVARGDITRRRDLAAAVAMLRPANGRILGVVLNADANVPGGGLAGFRVREAHGERAGAQA